MNKELFIPLLALSMFLIYGCKKHCWQCHSIDVVVYNYVKGQDTIEVQYIEDGPRHIYGDSLLELGYIPYHKEHKTLPIAFEICNEGGSKLPYKDCEEK
ncbi:MAG: hypothetical protein U0T75_00365 [Chitinophagales bacterium]